MALRKLLAITVLALTTTTSAQQTTSTSASESSVTNTDPIATITVFGNYGPAVGSLIGITSSVTTLALTCPADPPHGSCLLHFNLTMTAGPSTIAYTNPISNLTVFQHCQITSGVGGVCSNSRVGPRSVLAQNLSTVPTDELSATVTLSSVFTFGATGLTVINVPITAGETASLTGVTPVPTSTSSTTATSNEARTLLPGIAGAGLLGLLAVAL